MSLVNESQLSTVNKMFLDAHGRSPSQAELAQFSAYVPTESWEGISQRIRSYQGLPPNLPGMEISASFLGELGKVAKTAAGVIVGGATGGVAGAIAGGVKTAATQWGGGSGPPKVTMPGGGVIGPIIGGIIGGGLPRIPGLTSGSNGSGCGCSGSSGRDSCTQQRLSSQPAPLATFFGGCCPPGRVLRRVNNGRDICAKRAKMNVFNPQALARVDRRVTGFARRAAPILKDMGFSVSRARKVSLGKSKRKRR